MIIETLKNLFKESDKTKSNLNQLLLLGINDYLQKHLYNAEKYADPLKLNRFEYSAFSQNGEDGIIEEIFKRIGTTNKYFIEFGVESGVECNSTYLLHQGWKGLWIEGGKKCVDLINTKFKSKIEAGDLAVLQKFITRENIESLFESAGSPNEPDLLSIDIDGNDFYVWESITKYNPRVVIIEYNGLFKPGVEFKVNYDPNAVWDKSNIFGSSIESLYHLGNKKGYSLVGCCFTGVNAFFVRNDLIKNNFLEPFTTENHYEPQRFFLYKREE